MQDCPAADPDLHDRHHVSFRPELSCFRRILPCIVAITSNICPNFLAQTRSSQNFVKLLAQEWQHLKPLRSQIVILKKTRGTNIKYQLKLSRSMRSKKNPMPQGLLLDLGQVRAILIHRRIRCDILYALISAGLCQLIQEWSLLRGFSN